MATPNIATVLMHPEEGITVNGSAIEDYRYLPSWPVFLTTCTSIIYGRAYPSEELSFNDYRAEEAFDFLCQFLGAGNTLTTLVVDLTLPSGRSFVIDLTSVKLLGKPDLQFTVTGVSHPIDPHSTPSALLTMPDLPTTENMALYPLAKALVAMMSKYGHDKNCEPKSVENEACLRFVKFFNMHLNPLILDGKLTEAIVKGLFAYAADRNVRAGPVISSTAYKADYRPLVYDVLYALVVLRIWCRNKDIDIWTCLDSHRLLTSRI